MSKLFKVYHSPSYSLINEDVRLEVNGITSEQFGESMKNVTCALHRHNITHFDYWKRSPKWEPMNIRWKTGVFQGFLGKEVPIIDSKIYNVTDTIKNWVNDKVITVLYK